MKQFGILKTAALALFVVFVQNSNAQTGTAAEPISYVGGEICNPRLHEGGFRYAIGVENIQVMRANRTHPEEADNYGWTYNHAANITFWNGNFYLQYLSNPVDEQQPPGQTFIVTSADGRSWSKPIVAFPPYTAPKGVEIPKPYYGYIMHQRMGFYTAPNGRLLTVAFYGHSYNPFKEGGIGRVVREIKKDGSFGPIYFLRYSSHTNWNEQNTAYPFYTRSDDKGFRDACEALLNDKLRTLQWIDEDRGLDGFYNLKDSINRVQATNYYHRPDGQVVGLWKWSYAALSPDEGKTWSTPVRIPSLIMAGGKQWGQRTADGRYAICYNPIETQPYRYPLVAITSDDGIRFDNMCVVHGEVPPRRFMGENKDFGPCYVRGIIEGEQLPDTTNMWLAYTVNKEDVWVARVPLPIQTVWKGAVNDDFSAIEPKQAVPNWNIYRSQWCEAYVNKNHQLQLTNRDPYDYARAQRVFESSEQASVQFSITIEQENQFPFEVDITDRHGERFIALQFHKGTIYQLSLSGKTVIGTYQLGQKQTHELILNTLTDGANTFDGQAITPIHAVKALERISFRTGEYRNLPNRQTPNQDPAPPLAGCDEPIKQSSYLIHHLQVK